MLLDSREATLNRNQIKPKKRERKRRSKSENKTTMDRIMKNQNANETDYDKQFKEDLERATALSMETMALEEFRRNRSMHSVAAGDLSITSSSSSMKFSSCMYHTI